MLKVSSFATCFGYWTVGEFTLLENTVLEYFFTVLSRAEFGIIERLSYGRATVTLDGMVNQVVRVEGRHATSAYYVYLFAQRSRSVREWSIVGKSRMISSPQYMPDDLDMRWSTRPAVSPTPLPHREG